MNIAIKPAHINTREALGGKVSLVTGSTSGIGLGIARALAAAGSATVPNGFGKPDDRAQAQANIASDFKVHLAYFPADMSKPLAIREMREGVLQSSDRLDILVNNAGTTHSPIAGFPARKVGCDPCHQPVLRVPHHAARFAHDASEQMGSHAASRGTSRNSQMHKLRHVFRTGQIDPRGHPQGPTGEGSGRVWLLALHPCRPTPRTSLGK